MSFKITSFQPIHFPELSSKYTEGHRRVLSDFGIENISTNNDAWKQDPSVHAIVAISTIDNSIVGGIRIHYKNSRTSLPLKLALNYLDPKIQEWLNKDSQEEIAEICGLWNSKKVFGKGLSFFLTRAAVAYVRRNNLTKVVGLAAPYTREMSESVGFRVVSELGSNGTYNYPNEKHLASVMEIIDLPNISTATFENHRRIHSLSAYPIQNFQENYRNCRSIIHYNLEH